jgi:phosphoribosylpyrophosphate synthetase
VKHLNIHLGRATVGRFSDGEIMVEILENVRGKDVFVLQSTCAPTNDSLMEVILVMVDALNALPLVVSLPPYPISDMRARIEVHVQRVCRLLPKWLPIC